MKIAIGSDHRGYNLKETLKGLLTSKDIRVTDVGPNNTESVDYPDYSWPVAQLVGQGKVDFGILICGSGLGMSIAANKVPRIRATLCLTPIMAKMARNHNNANVLVMSADFTQPKDAEAIVEQWLASDFERIVRHKRRIQKIHAAESYATEPLELYEKDPEIYEAIQAETRRIQDQIILIASENLTSRSVREAQGSVLTNKYAEGYPGKRWYHGCENMDTVEQLAIDRAKQLFGAEHANVQPHSGTNANLAVYMSVMEPGDTLLAMNLAHGGHLSHGHPANYSGRMFKVHSYGVNRETEQIDYDEVERIAKECRPKLIVAGCSAYSRIIDFKRFREIADSVGAFLMADMAHIAGLVAGGCHPSPVPYSDFVTSTTHKTLGGPRGAFILCRERFAAEVDKQIFPGIQGGPLMHVVAAKAVCFLHAMRPSFRKYQQQIVKNSKALATRIAEKGFRIVSGGTDNHLFMVDLTPMDLTGQDAADRLSRANIICNKNNIPFETRSPQLTSGVRLGTPTVTARGMGESEMKTIADAIAQLLKNMERKDVLDKALEQVKALTSKYPVW